MTFNPDPNKQAQEVIRIVSSATNNKFDEW